MTTATRPIVFNNGSDGPYRVWAQAIVDLLKDAGMTQTADTGQLDIATATRPAQNSWSTAGIILQKTWPTGDSITLKLLFGSTNTNVYPMLQIDWSPYGSDGAGNLIRSRPAQAGLTPNFASWMATATNTTEFQCYACVHEATQSINMQLGGSAAGMFMSLNKRVDRVTGLPTPQKDYVVIAGIAASNCTVYGNSMSTLGSIMGTWRDTPYYASGMIGGNWCIIPYGITASPAGDKMIFPWRAPFPAAHIVLGGCTYLSGELSNDATFQVAIGSDPTLRTYRATGLNGGANGVFTPGKIALLWE